MKPVVKIQTDPEFEKLIPPLSDEEFAQLEENILEEGECHDPILLWQSVIVDGHNRWKIIQKHPEIDYDTRELIFFSRSEVMAWIIRNQLGRRNLPPYERAKLALRLKDAIAAEAKENQSTHTEQGYQKSDKAVNTNKELAKVAGVSHDTIHKVDVIEKKAPEEIKQQLSRGEVSINKAYNQVREPKQKEDVQKAAPIVQTHKEPEQEEKTTTPAVNNLPEMSAPEQYAPQYTIENLLEDIESHGETFVSILRTTLAEKNVLFAGNTTNRKLVYEAVHTIASRIATIENILK